MRLKPPLSACLGGLIHLRGGQHYGGEQGAARASRGGWFVAETSGRPPQGPYTEAQLKAWASSGQISLDTRVKWGSDGYAQPLSNALEQFGFENAPGGGDGAGEATSEDEGHFASQRGGQGRNSFRPGAGAADDDDSDEEFEAWQKRKGIGAREVVEGGRFSESVAAVKGSFGRLFGAGSSSSGSAGRSRKHMRQHQPPPGYRDDARGYGQPQPQQRQRQRPGRGYGAPPPPQQQQQQQHQQQSYPPGYQPQRGGPPPSAPYRPSSEPPGQPGAGDAPGRDHGYQGGPPPGTGYSPAPPPPPGPGSVSGPVQPMAGTASVASAPAPADPGGLDPKEVQAFFSAQKEYGAGNGGGSSYSGSVALGPSSANVGLEGLDYGYSSQDDWQLRGQNEPSTKINLSSLKQQYTDGWDREEGPLQIASGVIKSGLGGVVLPVKALRLVLFTSTGASSQLLLLTTWGILACARGLLKVGILMLVLQMYDMAVSPDWGAGATAAEVHASGMLMPLMAPLACHLAAVAALPAIGGAIRSWISPRLTASSVRGACNSLHRRKGLYPPVMHSAQAWVVSKAPAAYVAQCMNLLEAIAGLIGVAALAIRSNLLPRDTLISGASCLVGLLALDCLLSVLLPAPASEASLAEQADKVFAGGEGDGNSKRGSFTGGVVRAAKGMLVWGSISALCAAAWYSMASAAWEGNLTAREQLLGVALLWVAQFSVSTLLRSLLELMRAAPDVHRVYSISYGNPPDRTKKRRSQWDE
ncbi:unnamed protein product [Chrysoparadoxa australica]